MSQNIQSFLILLKFLKQNSRIVTSAEFSDLDGSYKFWLYILISTDLKIPMMSFSYRDSLSYRIVMCISILVQLWSYIFL